MDIENLKKRMASTIERVKADDPRELRKRIAELETALKKTQAAGPKVEVKEVPVLDDKEKRLLEKVCAQAEAIAKQIDLIKPILARALGAAQARPVQFGSQPQARAPIPRVTTEGGARLPNGELKILTALAQYPQGRTKKQIAVLTGYAHSGGAYNNYLGALRSKGWIVGSDALNITSDGLGALGPHEPLPKGDALYQRWLSQLGKAEREILRILVERYPNALSKDEIANLAGYEAKGGGFNNAIGRLRTLELIHGRGDIQAAKEFFE